MSVANVLNSPQIPSVPQRRVSLPLLLWQKICEIAKKVFNFFYFWKKPEYELSARQIAIIDQARQNVRQGIPRAPTPPPEDFYDSDDEEDVERNPERVIEDPSLNNLHESLTEFGSVISECVKTETIAPSVDIWKEDAAKFPETGKLWVKMFLDVKKYLDPIFARFPNTDEPLVMTLIHLVCNVLLENKTKNEIEEDVAAKLNDLLHKNVISEDLHQRLISAIQPTLNWIIQSNNMLLKSIDPVQLHELIIDTRNFFLQFSEMLLNGELDNTIDEIQAIIQENLGESLENLLDDNNHVISNFLGSRIVDLIQHMPYTTAFDELITRINIHLDAWIDADTKRKEEKKTIRAAEQSVSVYPANVDQGPKQKLEEYLDIIEEAGGEKEYLAQKFTVDFRNIVAGKYPNAVPLISKPGEGKTPKIVEEDEYHLFAENLYRLLLPPGKYELPFDIQLEEDGLAQIWKQIALPEMLKEVETKLIALFDTVLEKIESRNEENFKAYFYLFLKTFVFYHIRENKLIPMIKKGIGNIFEKFSDPASIREIFSETIMPRVSDKLFELFAEQVISNNLNVFAPLFCKLIESPGNRVSAAKKAVVSKLEEMMGGKFKDFNWEMMDRDRVPALVQPIIVEITQVLQDLKALNPTKVLQDAEVSKAIAQFYVSEKIETKKEFGEIIMKLLYKIGNFNSTWSGWLVSFFKDTLAQVATVGFKGYRSSYHAVVNTIVKAGESHFLNEDYVKETFFGEEVSEEEAEAKREEIDEQLPEQFKAIASQTHDMLYDGAGGRFTPATETLNLTLQSIFKKVFKRKEINKSLVFQFFQVLDDAFKSSVIRGEFSQDLKYRVQLINSD